MPSTTQTTAIANQVAIAAALGLVTVGDVYYVDSTHANKSDVSKTTGRQGTAASRPFATLDYAIGQCTADNGDLIIVAAGHAETLTAAAGIDADTAGITIIGLGSGQTRPTFTMGTATTCDVDIDAANITFKNLRFVSAIDSLAVMLDVNEGSFKCEDCEFVGPATFEVVNFVNIATTKDDFIFRNCVFHQPADPGGTDGAAGTGVFYVVDTERIVVEGCTFDGFFETAVFHNKTTACKYLTWKNNSVNQQLTITGRRILLVAGTVGMDIGVDTDFVPGLGYRIQKTEDVNTATADVLFTVAGKVLISEWYGEVTNALGAGVTDYALDITSGASLQAAGNLSSAAIGHTFRVNSDAGDTTLATTTPAVSVVDHADLDNDAGPARRLIGREGLTTLTLQSTRTAGDASDAILHTIWYIPLEPGAHIVAAA